MTKFEVLQQELRPDEKLLWSEEADAIAYVNGGTLFTLVFVCAWTGSAFLLTKQDSEGSAVWGWVFGGIGVFFIGSLLCAMLKSLFTLYAISNQRLLIVRHYPWSTTVESYGRADIKFVRKTRKRSGAGDIVFTTTPHSGNKGRVTHEDVGFFGVDDADAVERLILDTFRPATHWPQT